jgi:hypothetical protein
MGSFRVGCLSLVVVVVHCVLCEREVLCVRAFCIVRSSAGCEDQPCSWVHREGREEKERENLQAKSTDRTVCFHIISRNIVLWM